MTDTPGRDAPLPTQPNVDDEEFYRWYGPWQPLDPQGVATALKGAKFRWWIIGGWAIEAFTGKPREHEDIDVSFFRADLGRVLDHLNRDFCVWSNASGTLRPLKTPDDLLPDCRQMWVRADGAQPWVLDLAMNPHDGDTWISVRDDQIRMPIDDATFTNDGISYLKPEIVMAMKARWARGKDDRDLAEVLPLLEPDRVDWLRRTIEGLHPGHRWLEAMGS